jgi:hypothetical protein
MKRGHRFSKTVLGKTILWNAGNWIFGLAPLGLMILIKKLSSNPEASQEVYHLIHDGLPLFVACAIMGSIVVDFFLSNEKLTGLSNFFSIIMPCAVFGLLLLVYLLIIIKLLPDDYFSYTSWIYWLEIGFSLLYCSFAKYAFYKEQL